MNDNWDLTTSPTAKTDPVFVGVGEIPSGKYPDRSFIGDLTEVAIRALRDASMRPDDVDTILLIPNLHSFDDHLFFPDTQPYIPYLFSLLIVSCPSNCLF